MSEKLKNIFENKKVLIIGDVMIDAYIWGIVDRISPEAPVPIVVERKRENRLGGAANVALNVKSLGSEAVLASVVGNDDMSLKMMSLFDQQGLPTKGILKSSERITTSKFRIIGNNAQMLRVDEETDLPLSESLRNKFIDHVLHLIDNDNFDVIIFEDYDKGVIDEKLVSAVLEKSDELNIPVTVDPKKRNFFFYSGVTMFKPNLKELSNAVNMELPREIPSLAKVVEDFRRKMNYKYMLLTLGERGMLLCYDENNTPKYYHIPSRVRNVCDVSGAGDTVISVASIALSQGCLPCAVCDIANFAAGIVCEYVGVVPVDKNRLFADAASVNI